MRLLQVIAGIIFGSELMEKIHGDQTLFDFTKLSNVDNWQEISDTVRTVGMSKAVLTLQKTQVFQRAIFFTLLNPQPNGAGFAGMRVPVKWDLRAYDEFRLRCRGQGQNSHYKIVLRHRNLSSDDDIAYEQFFDPPMSNSTFGEVSVPLSKFQAFFRGREVKDAQPLDLGQVTMFGLQVYGGVYLPIKQSGVSALEIELIEARKAN